MVRKPSTGGIIAKFTNQIVPLKFRWRYKNVVLYLPDTLSSCSVASYPDFSNGPGYEATCSVEGGLGTRLESTESFLPL